MIITITGKPCSGKDDVCKAFCNKFNFSSISTGKIFRQAALDMGYSDIADFQKPEQTKLVDAYVDNQLIEIGKTRFNENLIVVSRTAWHFIPNSFKVYLDVDWKEAGKRLIGANRESEQSNNEKEASAKLKQRYADENKRFKKIYNINPNNKKNYNLVVNSTNKTVEEIVKIIYDAYKKFILK